MPRLPSVLASTVVVLLASSARAQELVAPTDPLSAEEQGGTFQLPPGFEIQLVAAEPVIRKPINLAFDAAGRLYATESIEYPYAAAEDAPHRDSVKVFWDLAPDGRAQQSAVAVDGLNIPMGVAPLVDSLLVYSIRDGVLRCWDRDGDGRYEERRSILSGFGFDDTHGMVNSLVPWVDGWVYACHGFRNDSRTQGADGQAIEMNSGNTFRFRPDGSRVEHWTHGQVNPFGLSFDPLGNVYAADCHTLPAYQLLRGAWYPSFGKPHDGLGFGSPLMQHNHGSTGIAGIVYYAADQFPAEWRDTLFIGNPVTGRLNHDRLERHGSTFTAIEQPDFLSSSDGWFRPVDIELGPDGALYIADFYNRIIGHYEVPLEHPGRDRERGRIWRIAYTGNGAAPAAMPDIARASAEELIALLDSPNLPLCVQGVEQLVERIGAATIEPLRAKLASDATANQRALATWVLERLGALDAAALSDRFNDPSTVVCVHALKAAAERRDWDDDLTSAVSDCLAQGRFTPPERWRAAADALARHPNARHIVELLGLWMDAPANDTHLIHVARMALRDQLAAPGAYEEVRFLSGKPAYAQRLAEINLGTVNAAGGEHSLWYVSHHAYDRQLRADCFRHAARYQDASKLAELYASAQRIREAVEPLAEQFAVVRSLFRGLQERGLALPDDQRAWGIELVNGALRGMDEGLAREAIDVARELRLAECYDALAAAAGPEAPFPVLRPAALEACVASDAQRSIELASAVVGGGQEPIELRERAAVALGSIADPLAAERLLSHLPSAPGRLALAIAGGLAGTPVGAEALLTNIAQGKASARLLQDRNIEGRLRAHNLPDFDARLAALTENLPPAEARLAELIDQRRQRFPQVETDLALGQQVFKKTCAICHRLRGEGTKIGPELDGIGLRGLDRLLEDLLDPSRNVDQAFRGTQIVTTDGRAIVGLKLREEGQVLVLADAQGKEVRVPADEIDEQTLTTLSAMPANVAEVVPEEDFYHLLAFLLAQREKPAAGQ